MPDLSTTLLTELRDAQLHASRTAAAAAEARAALAQAEAEHHQALDEVNRAIDALILEDYQG